MVERLSRIGETIVDNDIDMSAAESVVAADSGPIAQSKDSRSSKKK